MSASIRTTASEGYEFADDVVGLFKSLECLPPKDFLPRYSTFVKTSKSRFVVGSTFTFPEYLACHVEGYTFNLPAPHNKVDLGQIKGFFRKLRNGFIRKIAPNVIDREQNFFDAMVTAGVERLDVGRKERAMDSWKRAVKVPYDDGKPQSSAFGTTWKWDKMARGQKCMKCWLLHRFCELPPVVGPVASYWVKEFKVCNCSEPLAVGILEGQISGF